LVFLLLFSIKVKQWKQQQKQEEEEEEEEGEEFIFGIFVLL
jgi:hypothetical protein